MSQGKLEFAFLFLGYGGPVKTVVQSFDAGMTEHFGLILIFPSAVFCFAKFGAVRIRQVFIIAY